MVIDRVTQTRLKRCCGTHFCAVNHPQWGLCWAFFGKCLVFRFISLPWDTPLGLSIALNTSHLNAQFFIDRTSEAAEIYRDVCRLDKGHVDAICNLALILSNENGTDDKAVEDLYTKALR